MGVIGYGGMGSWHCENVRDRIEGLEIGGIYDIREERRAQAAADGFPVYGSAEELLSSDINLVLVATPNHVHREYSVRAMRAGKHVICEKPVCMNAAELEGAIAVSRETGKLFTVHQNRRWDVDYAIVKNILDRRLVGNTYFIDSRLYGSKGLPGDWRSTYLAGGGMLYDWSVHLIDQMLDLVKSRPIRVFAEVVKVKFPEVDDCNRIHICFENGIRALIVVDSWCYIDEPRWHISGDDGTAAVNRWFGREGRIVKANVKQINWEEGCIFTGNGRSRTMSPRPVEDLQELPLPVPAKEPRWEEFYENVIAVMEGKADPIVTHEQMLAVMRLIDACFLSAKENRSVDLDEEGRAILTERS